MYIADVTVARGGAPVPGRQPDSEDTLITVRQRTFPALAATLIALSVALPALAVETKVIRDDNFTDFNHGESTGTELLSQGRLRIGPKPVRIHRTDDGIAWQIAVDPFDGSLFYCTGHDGKVFRVLPDGKAELWADLEEVEAISIAVDPTGGVLVGASPGGSIYRIVEAGKPKVFFETKEQYVWDMIFDRNGVLYAATGTNGKIFRIRGQNNGEVFYDSDATNIMALNFDGAGNLLAATQGKGMVLRVAGPGSAYVLHASTEDECRALTVDKNGNIYAAVNSVRTSSLFDRISEKDEKPASGSASGTPAPTPRAGLSAGGREAVAMLASSGMGTLSGQGSIVQIQPSGFVSVFWNSPEAPIHAIMADPDGEGILVAAGKKGKIYRLFGDSNYSVVSDVEEQAVLSFAAHKGKTYFTTANKAAIYSLLSSPAPESSFASRTLNAGSTVAWGNIYYDAEEPSGSTIVVETRTGNTADPFDRNWGQWAEAKRLAPRILKPDNPVAQYLQYRIALRAGADGKSAVLDGIQFFYVQQNAAPVIKEVRLEKVGGEATPASPAAGARLALPSPRPAEGSGSGKDDSADAARKAIQAIAGAAAAARADEPASTPAPSSSLGAEQNSAKFNVSWDATDPNGDKLVYRLLYKAEDESEWKVLEKEFSATKFALGTDNLPDGRYRLKVEATDRSQNADDRASSAVLVSRVFIVDNNPPAVLSLKAQKVAPNEWEITAEAEDALSIIASAAHNLDGAKEWRMVGPEDGIFDFGKESFRFRITPEKESPEHTLRLRVVDREGNARVEKVLLR